MREPASLKILNNNCCPQLEKISNELGWTSIKMECIRAKKAQQVVGLSMRLRVIF
jgi:hypothetical protein